MLKKILWKCFLVSFFVFSVFFISCGKIKQKGHPDLKNKMILSSYTHGKVISFGVFLKKIKSLKNPISFQYILFKKSEKGNKTGFLGGDGFSNSLEVKGSFSKNFLKKIPFILARKIQSTSQLDIFKSWEKGVFVVSRTKKNTGKVFYKIQIKYEMFLEKQSAVDLSSPVYSKDIFNFHLGYYLKTKKNLKAKKILNQKSFVFASSSNQHIYHAKILSYPDEAIGFLYQLDKKSTLILVYK